MKDDKDVFCSHRSIALFSHPCTGKPCFFTVCFFLPSPWKSAFDYSSKWWGSLLLDNDKPSWTKLLKNGGAPRFFQGTPRSFFQLSPEKWWHLKEADPASEFWMIYFATGRAVKLRSMQYSFDDFRRPVARRAHNRFFFVAKRLNRDEQLMRDTSGQSERPLLDDFFWRDP